MQNCANILLILLIPRGCRDRRVGRVKDHREVDAELHELLDLRHAAGAAPRDAGRADPAPGQPDLVEEAFVATKMHVSVRKWFPSPSLSEK